MTSPLLSISASFMALFLFPCSLISSPGCSSFPLPFFHGSSATCPGQAQLCQTPPMEPNYAKGLTRVSQIRRVKPVHDQNRAKNEVEISRT